MRQEALAVMPIWARPLAGLKVNQLLRDKGFVKSDEECMFCCTGDAEESK